LGTEEMPTRPWTAESVVDFAKTSGAISVVAHPYREYGMGDQARSFKVDAIEVVNGASPWLANEAAKRLARLMGLPGVAGSDAHQTSELCTVHTQIQASMDIDEILKAIRQGLVSVPAIGRSIHF